MQENKKCAAEAAHKKYMAPKYRQTQLNTTHKSKHVNIEHVFLSKDKKHTYCLC